jgi:hypothetical protein
VDSMNGGVGVPDLSTLKAVLTQVVITQCLTFVPCADDRNHPTAVAQDTRMDLAFLVVHVCGTPNKTVSRSSRNATCC